MLEQEESREEGGGGRGRGRGQQEMQSGVRSVKHLTGLVSCTSTTSFLLLRMFAVSSERSVTAGLARGLTGVLQKMGSYKLVEIDL